MTNKITKQRQPNNQRGLASMIAVLLLLIVVSIISLGFAKLMDRATQQSLGNNLNQAAYLAARSGINDVRSLLKVYPDTTATTCGALFATGQPFAGSASQLSSNSNTKYTCILIDKTPLDAAYQGIDAFKSQVTYLESTSVWKNLMVSWQSSDRNLMQFVPVASGQKFYDETTWGTNLYAPAMRVSLYPIRTSNDLSQVANAAATYFLYPNLNGGTTVTTAAYNAGSNLVSVGCKNPPTLTTGTFSGTADYDCNVIITGLDGIDPSGGGGGTIKRYVIRLTPLYVKADIKLKANNTSNQAIQFAGGQYVIDVTAKAGNAVKRLQARVNAPGPSVGQDSTFGPNDDAFPEYGLRAANSICKRLNADSATSRVTVDASISAYCNLSLP